MSSISNEFDALRRAYEIRIMAPRPLHREMSPAALGGAFLLMAEIPNAVSGGVQFARDRAHRPRIASPKLALDAARELAKLHKRATDVESCGSTFIAARDIALAEATQGWTALRTKASASQILDISFAWLAANPPSSHRPRCLVHEDFGLHNLLVRDGRLVAVIDWELAATDDPAIDLAQCRMLMLEDTVTWDEFVAAYVAAGGDPSACDERAVLYYCVWIFSVKYGLMVAHGRDRFLSVGLH